ncbi:MAG: hypothetical protein JJT96_18300 [Opitutales bacterium]|nr:hypothetical protein [Opitutales bacterium]
MKNILNLRIAPTIFSLLFLCLNADALTPPVGIGGTVASAHLIPVSGVSVSINHSDGSLIQRKIVTPSSPSFFFAIDPSLSGEVNLHFQGFVDSVLVSEDKSGGVFVYDLSYDPEAGLWASATERGRGWLDFDWFGYFHNAAFASSGWIYHLEHGWQHYMGSDVSSLVFYDFALESWGWTSATAYPWLYLFADVDHWLFYLRGSEQGERWFYIPQDDEWYHENDL